MTRKKGARSAVSRPEAQQPPEWQPLFIDELRETGNVRAACAAAGISRTWAYETKKVDPSFAALWDEALEDACDDLEGEARRRARHGVEKPVFQGGSQVGVVREYSDTLLIFLLKAHRPEKYRENFDVTLRGKVKITGFEDLSDDELDRLLEGG